MTQRRRRRSRTAIEKETLQQNKLETIRQEAASFDNKMMADMYVYACEQKIIHNNSKFLDFMGGLAQVPVPIHEFLDSQDFLGGTDLTLWPAVKESLITMHRNWYKGADGGAYTEAIFAGSTGNAKCWSKNTPILMFDGSVKMVQDVEVGDLVMGPDSKPRKVGNVHSGRETMYKIVPVKGDAHICNESHILSLKKTGTSSRGKYKPGGEIVNISIRDYLATNKTFKHTHKLWRTGIAFPHKEVFDPYIIGLYLADGTKEYNRLCCGEVKQPCLDYVASKITVSSKRYRKGAWYYNLAGFSATRKTLLTESGERYIPDEYLVNDEHNRLQLLAGLLDGDGAYITGCHAISCKDKVFADQILFLCRSLGFAAYATKIIGCIKSSGFTGTYYRISISGDLDRIPNKVIHKQATPRKQKKDVLRTGFTLEKLEEGTYYGITVDKDHLYLLGDFTVAHNTTQSVISLLYFAHILGCLRNPQEVYGFSSSTGITLAIFAAKPSVMRKAVYMPLRGLLEQMTWFRQYMPWDDALKSEIYFFKQNMRITPAGMDADSVIGEAVIAVLIDEANFFPVVKQSKKVLALEGSGGRSGEYDQVRVLYDTVNRRRESRFMFRGQQVGMVIVSSSKKYVGDFTDKRIEHVRNYDKSDVYIYDKTQPEVVPPDRFCGKKFKIAVNASTNDGIQIFEDVDELSGMDSKEYILPIEYLDKFRSDPYGSLRDVLGIASTAITPFFTNRLKILQTIERSEKEGHESFLRQDNVALSTYGLPMVKDGHLCRNPHVPRFVHVDLSLTSDFCGIGMASFGGMVERERSGGIKEVLPTVVVDMACSIAPDHGTELDIAQIRAWVKSLKVNYRYPINTVSYDTFQSAESIQAWRKMGVKSGNITVDRNSKAYKAFRELLYDDRLTLLNNSILTEEMMTVEYDITKDKVDHPYGLCFTGDTLVLLADGTCKSFYQLVYDRHAGIDNYIITYDTDTGEYRTAKAQEPRLTKYTADLVEIHTADSLSFRCTPEHRILLSSGDWCEAQNLIVGDWIMTNDDYAADGSGYVYGVARLSLGFKVPVYDISVDGTETFCLANGCVVHNSKDLLDAVVGAVYSLLSTPAMWVSMVQDSDVDEDSQSRTDLGERQYGDNTQRR